jgi:hypothetical protein
VIISMRFRQAWAFWPLAWLVCGCASIVNGTTEPIYVTTAPEPGANCTISNAQGSWSVVTPGTVTVKKSESVLAVHCAKDGRRDAKEYFASKLSTATLVGGLIPYAGIITTAVDGSSGASGEYPNTITITMPKADPIAQGTTANANTTLQAAGRQLLPEGAP